MFPWPSPARCVTAVCVLTSFHLSAAVCNRERWFGPTRCLYQCHCAGDVPCDKTNGACPQGCQSGWFGPACQYETTSYNFSSLPPGDDGAWLLDHSDDTCNNGTAHTVNLNLTSPHPLTWVRLVLSQPGRQDQLHVSYQDSSAGGITPCQHARRAKVDERTLDILCPTQTAVDSVTVSGAGVQELCSLYISAGRNVALKQATTQSSTFNSWAASNAVDGKQGEPGRNPARLEKTCSHTNNHNIGWWKVTFSRAVNINSFVIYNRRRDQPDDINVDCCESRLRGFTLRAFQDGVSGAVYTYTDTAASAKPVYEVVPTHTIDGPVRTVNITKRQSSPILTLCEVLVLGETVCPAGKFGLNCDRQCNCADTQELCFVSTGGCTSGCAPGFTGEDCHTACPGKTYGSDCVGTCSDHCRSSQICSADNGHCVDGCKPGYTPPLCDDECPKTTFGQECRENCSSSCVDSDCDHVNGTCKQCPPGYTGDYCDQECPLYTFGDGCSENCSALCVDRICNHTTGACGNCTEGREGHFCEIVPPVESGAGGFSTGDVNGGGGGSSGATIGAGVGAALGLFILVTITLVFVWRRRHNNKPDKERTDLEALPRTEHILDTSLSRGSSNLVLDSCPHVAKASRATEDKTESVYSNVLPSNTCIEVKELSQFLQQHTTDSFLQDQFQSVPMTNSYSQRQGLSPENVKKNRYKNIVPYDHSRVMLQVNSDKEWEDYINASFVKGYDGTNTFIAAQAPNNLTLQDFVRMLWEHEVDRIVMLTNLVELKKIKCTQYWPANDEQTFGEIRMKLLTTRVFAQYTVRQIRLHQKNESPRTVTQFHFTAWPDKSVPSSAWGLVDLHQRVQTAPGSGKLLVHCSAGVGRTGTFIALTHLLQEAEATGKMDFLSTLWRLRQDRMSMIQTVDQFRFLHRAALIGHTTSGTSIAASDLSIRLGLLDGHQGAGLGYIREFEAVANAVAERASELTHSADDTEVVYENSGTATSKQLDRDVNILPKDTYRPELQCDGNTLGDYINAVLVPTVSKDRQDILTQLPLPSTVTDFWRLVTQYHVELVVAFETDSKHSDETIGEFLPPSGAAPLCDDLFEIHSRTLEENQLWQELSASVTKKKKLLLGSKAEQHHVTCLLCKDTDPDPEIVLEYLRKVKSCQAGKESRTVYMCRNGADHCGFLCVQSILLDRLEVDECVTVPLMVGAVRAIRPQVISSVDQYKCLYRTLKLAHDTSNIYGNVGHFKPPLGADQETLEGVTQGESTTDVTTAPDQHVQRTEEDSSEELGRAVSEGDPQLVTRRQRGSRDGYSSARHASQSDAVGENDGGSDDGAADIVKSGVDNPAFHGEKPNDHVEKEGFTSIEYANM